MGLTSFPWRHALAVGLVLLIGVGIMLYQRITQPRPEILAWMQKNPDQPRPELVGQWMSPALVLLILVVLVGVIVGVVAVWRSRTSL